MQFIQTIILLFLGIMFYVAFTLEYATSDSVNKLSNTDSIRPYQDKRCYSNQVTEKMKREVLGCE